MPNEAESDSSSAKGLKIPSPQEVVKRCLRAGVTEFVVCGGARNAALLEALARAEAAGVARVWSHFEERSAGFFALGRTVASGRPCAVVTTSGTAVAELLPAVIEAFYQARPLVALTADRPQEFRGSGAPQAIVQPGIFGSYAFGGDFADWDGKGPLHLNVELEEESQPGEDRFSPDDVGEFAVAKDRLDVAALARWLREGIYRGLVVLIGGLEPDEREEVYHFCTALKAPVVADATSGLREALQAYAIPDGDRALAARPPGKILRLGDVPTGRFWRDLESMPDISVWSVCRQGLPGLARTSQVMRAPLSRALPALGSIEPVEDAMDYLPESSRRADRIEELLERFPDSEPAMMRTLSTYASIGSGVFLGNSLPVREWNLFGQWDRPIPEVRANRGANGIDGQVSTWLGWSAEMRDSWGVFGDLTALYDLAAPFVLAQVEREGRVLAVLNNSGGKIFSRLPRLRSMSPRAAEWMINRHEADFAAAAKLWGMRHMVARTADDFDQCESGPVPLLLEVVPSEKQTTQFWGAWDRMG
jgi:2-succinyl-5-enolpyruvyl-6-hydroxy-3-cyclohexene-1-carboxylate synthase